LVFVRRKRRFFSIGRAAELLAHFADEFLRQTIRREDDLADFALGRFAQGVLFGLELFQLALGLLELEHLFFQASDVTIGCFQLRHPRAQGAMQAAQLGVDARETSLDLGKKRFDRSALLPAPAHRAGFDLDHVAIIVGDETVACQGEDQAGTPFRDVHPRTRDENEVICQIR